MPPVDPILSHHPVNTHLLSFYTWANLQLPKQTSSHFPNCLEFYILLNPTALNLFTLSTFSTLHLSPFNQHRIIIIIITTIITMETPKKAVKWGAEADRDLFAACLVVVGEPKGQTLSKAVELLRDTHGVSYTTKAASHRM